MCLILHNICNYVCYIIFSGHGLLPGHIYPSEHLQPNKYTVNQVQPQAASNKPSLSKMCSRTLEDQLSGFE